jgi:hypothetical protein
MIRNQTKASTEAHTEHLCPAGLHPMDPNWDTCPYCDAQRKSKQPSKSYLLNSPEMSGGGRYTTAEQAPAASGHVTETYPSGPHVRDAGLHRIVGVLVTYSLRQDGDLFAVREGRNLIGWNRECHISIPNDGELSNEHALILYRQGQFEIIDKESTNGTRLNGEMLKSNQGVELPDHAEIKTGQTIWYFMKVKVPPGHLEPKPTVEPKEPERQPGGPRTIPR